MAIRASRYRLAPTADQVAVFARYSGVCRLVYNLALEQRRDWWMHFKRQNGRNLNYLSQARELTALRSDFPWIAEVSQTCQQEALRDLDQAFTYFFTGKSRFPTPRRRGANESFRFQGRRVETKKLNAKWSAVRLPKIGWVKYRATRDLGGAIKTATVSLDPIGWHVAFTYEREPAQEISAERLAAVGIDRGVTHTLTLSTGEHLSPPKGTLQILERRRRKARKLFDKRKRGSKRRLRALARMRCISSKAARIRKDWHHRTTTEIARRFNCVTIENLRVSQLASSGRRKNTLNHRIFEQGWFTFEEQLAYKLDDRGGSLTKVRAAYTSQTCATCGAVDKASRIDQSTFRCTGCGLTANADVNAAINILRRNTAYLRMEGKPFVSSMKCEPQAASGLPKPSEPERSGMLSGDVHPETREAAEAKGG